MASITVKMDDTKLNALQFQLGKKGMDFNQEIQNLMGPALEKFYERQVPAAVREFVRALIMGLDIRPLPPDEYARILRELSAIGNNLNQITRIANATYSVAPPELARIWELFGEAWRLIREHF